MSNTRKKAACIIGILVGIAIMVIGVIILKSPDRLTLLIVYVGDNMRALGHIIEILLNILKAIGWLIVALGMTDISFFIYKLCSFKESKTIEKQ